MWTRDLALIILVNLCVFVNHIMSLSTFPFYIQSLDGTEAGAGACTAPFCLAAVVCRPFVGWWLDNGARRVALVVGLLLLGLAPLGHLFTPVRSCAIAFRMLHGAALSFSHSTTATVASDVIARPRFAEGMGRFGMATALASALAPALGLTLMEQAGHGVLYAMAAGIALLGLILFLFVRAQRVEVPHTSLRIKGLINRDSLPASCTMLVFMFTLGALENFVPIFASNEGLPSGSVYFMVMSVPLLVVRGLGRALCGVGAPLRHELLQADCAARLGAYGRTRRQRGRSQLSFVRPQKSSGGDKSDGALHFPSSEERYSLSVTCSCHVRPHKAVVA